MIYISNLIGYSRMNYDWTNSRTNVQVDSVLSQDFTNPKTSRDSPVHTQLHMTKTFELADNEPSKVSRTE